MKRVKRSGRSEAGVKRQYLSRAEVARLFDVSPATVARWAREGRLPHISTLGGHRRYRADEILLLVEKVNRPRFPESTARRGGIMKRSAIRPAIQ